MRVLLVWPRNLTTALNDDMSCCEPLPLEYLASALVDRHEVIIHDERLDGSLHDWAAYNEPPDVVGIAIPYTISVPSSRRVSQEARALWPDAVLVLGGHHPTVTNRWMDGFDAHWVIRGEGTQILSQLVDALAQKKQIPVMAGLTPYGTTPLPLASKPPLSQLETTPLPDRSLLKRNQLSYFHSNYRPIATMRFSAGCPHTCNFCVLWKLTGQRYLVKTIDRVLAELDQISVPNVYVVDDEAFIQPVRMRELASAIESAGFSKRFHMYLRTDTALRNPDVIEQWARAGLDSVLVGAESTSEEELSSYHKRTKPSQTHEAMRLFHENGVRVRANFLVDPAWGEGEFDSLERAVVELDIDTPSFSVLTPLPGTQLFEEISSQIRTDNPEMFDLYHSVLPTRLAPERFHDRMAQLLETAAGRSADGSQSIFYFGDDSAFGRMLQDIRTRWEPALALDLG